MGWMVWGSNPGGGEIFRIRPDRPRDPPSHLCIGDRVFLGVKWPGHGVDHPPPSGTKVKERVEVYNLLPLWAFVACSRVTFTFTVDYVSM
jgi:hypothetical protein